MIDPVSMSQQVQLEPGAARVASILRKLVGPPRAVVECFVLQDGEGKEVRASTDDLLRALEDFRGGSSEQPETYFSRLAARLRGCFR